MGGKRESQLVDWVKGGCRFDTPGLLGNCHLWRPLHELFVSSEATSSSFVDTSHSVQPEGIDMRDKT